MAIEAGARTGLVAVDEKTIAYLKDRPLAPKGVEWDLAVAYWKTNIPVADVARLPQYPALADGITANDREEALGIVEQIRTDLSDASAGT